MDRDLERRIRVEADGHAAIAPAGGAVRQGANVELGDVVKTIMCRPAVRRRQADAALGRRVGGDRGLEQGDERRAGPRALFVFAGGLPTACWTRPLDRVICRLDVERGHGCWRVASQSRSRSIRADLSRQQDRGGRPAAADGRRPQGHRRLRRRRPAPAPFGHRRRGRRCASSGAARSQARFRGPQKSGRRRAPPDHGAVLRPRRLDQPRGAMDAEDWRTLVNAYLDAASDGGDGARRSRAEEARRRADGAVRLPRGAGERRRARGACGARHPARAHGAQCARPACGAPETCGPHRRRVRLGRRGRDGRGVRRGAEHRRAGPGGGGAGVGSGHRHRAAADRRAVRGRGQGGARAQGAALSARRSTASCERAAAAGAEARAR